MMLKSMSLTSITDEELFTFILDSIRQSQQHIATGAVEAVKYRLDVIESVLSHREPKGK